MGSAWSSASGGHVEVDPREVRQMDVRRRTKSNPLHPHPLAQEVHEAPRPLSIVECFLQGECFVPVCRHETLDLGRNHGNARAIEVGQLVQDHFWNEKVLLRDAVDLPVDEVQLPVALFVARDSSLK